VAIDCAVANDVDRRSMSFLLFLVSCLLQGNHLSGKPANVRDFDSCQGNVRDFTKSQGSVRETILAVKSCLKLFIVSCIFSSILDFAKFVHFGFGSCTGAFLPAPLTITLVVLA